MAFPTIHLEFPTDEDDEDYYPYRNVGRSNSDFDVIAMAAMYAGIYEPGRYEWVRVGDSDDHVFRTDDINYGHIELKAVVSKDSNSATVKDPYEENDSYNVVVPKSVTVTLTAGGKTMLSQVFTNTFDLSAGTLKATETLSAANIRVETVLNATNSQATSNVSFSVSGEQIISGTAVINGRNLCNPEYIANIVDNEAWASLLSNGTFNANILDRIKVNGNVTFTPQLFEVYDDLSFDYGWGDMTREEASKECDNAVKVIANSVNAWLSFGNSSSREAWLVPVKRNYEWNSGWDDQEYGEYDAEWVVKFADGTTYSDDLLETGFDAVLNQWYQLVRSYQNCWN